MNVNNKPYQSIWRQKGSDTVFIVDQRPLPHKFVVEELNAVRDVVKAIKDMHVRGAPLIGVTAAYGIYFAAKESSTFSEIENFAQKIKDTRPTAVNLEWAVDVCLKHLAKADRKEWVELALEKADQIREESIDRCRKIGEHGLALIESVHEQKPESPVNILTHCNAGWLACVDYGTATAPNYLAHEKGIPLHVWVDETRPRNQGARITAFELAQQGIPHTVIVDNAGGLLMQKGMVDMVLVGSDRTSRNGDVANKIGTYLKALAAHDNNIPFYVALPSSTLDLNIEDGSEIPIEERSSSEVSMVQGMINGAVQKIFIIPKDSSVSNYGFDITPAQYVSKLITELGICDANEKSIVDHLAKPLGSNE